MVSFKKYTRYILSKLDIFTLRSVTDVNATTIESIALMQGNPLFLTTVIPNILTNGSIPVSDLGYNWTVPTTLPPSTDCKFYNCDKFTIVI